LSAATIAELERQTRALALALEVGGLMNVQYAIKDGEIYVWKSIRARPRTVPFVAKVIGIPGRQDRGARDGGRTRSRASASSRSPCTTSASRKRFSPSRAFPGSTTVLGPEMRSTGEVIGLDHSFQSPSRKARSAADRGLRAPKDGVQADDLRRSSASRTQHGVDPGKAREGENRFLDADVVQGERLEARSSRAVRPPSRAPRSWRPEIPITLATNGTVRDARGLTSST